MRHVGTPRSPLLIAAIQLGLLFFFIYYTFIGGQTAQGIYDHQWRLITLWVTSLLIGSWLFWRLLGSSKIPRTPFDLPLLFLLGVWILATFFSVNQIYSREALVFFVFYLFFFYVAIDLGRWPWFSELVFNAIIGVSGLIWALALWQLLHWYQDIVITPTALQGNYNPLASLPRLSVLGNPNTMASFVALVLPLVLYKITMVTKLITRILLGIWVIMLPTVLLLTQSRGGLLAFIAGLGFYAVVWIWQHVRVENEMEKNVVAGTPHPSGRKGGKWFWFLAVGVVAMVMVTVGVIFRFRTFSQGVDIRIQVMHGAFKTLTQHPFVGSGPGTLGEELIRHQRPLDIIWADAHNMFLTLIAETGLIGAIGLLWLGIVSIKFLWFVFQKTDRSQWSMGSMACLAALIGFAVHGLVDSQFKFPIIMLVAAILAGFCVAPYWHRGLSAKVWPTSLVAAALVILAANTFVGSNGIKNIRAYNQAVVAANQNNWPQALVFLQTADQLAPHVPFYQSQLGLTTGLLADEDHAYLSEAISYYREATSQLNTLAVDHANLACLLAMDGQAAEALEAMITAHQLEPENPLYQFNLGNYYEETHEFQRAWGEYAAVIARQPYYLQSSYWRKNKVRLAALPGIVEQAAESLNTQEDKSLLDLAELNLYAEDYESALRLYEQALAQVNIDSADVHLGKARTLWAMGRVDEAKRELDTAVSLDVASSKSYLYLSKIALAVGDISAASKHITTALFLNKVDGEILYQAALVAETTGDNATAADYYDAAFQQTLPHPPVNIARYATEVARRRPLPAAYLPCLVQIYQTPLLTAITEAQGDLLERQGKAAEAVQVYRRLLDYEPDVTSVITRLDALCQQYPDNCEE